MPAKANWLRKIARVQRASTELTAADVALLLGVSTRRAQQLTAAVPARMIGNVRVMQPAAIARVLRGKASTLDNSHELDRLQSLRAKLDAWNQEIIGPDRLMVAAPVDVINTSLDGLPAGVSIGPGRITLDVNDGEHALQSLLTLCFAIKNSFESFDLAVRKPRL